MLEGKMELRIHQSSSFEHLIRISAHLMAVALLSMTYQP